jgi:hypothetical protein
MHKIDAEGRWQSGSVAMAQLVLLCIMVAGDAIPAKRAMSALLSLTAEKQISVSVVPRSKMPDESRFIRLAPGGRIYSDGFLLSDQHLRRTLRPRARLCEKSVTVVLIVSNSPISLGDFYFAVQRIAATAAPGCPTNIVVGVDIEPNQR